jgi:hypothetical protein
MFISCRKLANCPKKKRILPPAAACDIRFHCRPRLAVARSWETLRITLTRSSSASCFGGGKVVAEKTGLTMPSIMRRHDISAAPRYPPASFSLRRQNGRKTYGPIRKSHQNQKSRSFSKRLCRVVSPCECPPSEDPLEEWPTKEGQKNDCNKNDHCLLSPFHFLLLRLNHLSGPLHLPSDRMWKTRISFCSLGTLMTTLSPAEPSVALYANPARTLKLDNVPRHHTEREGLAIPPVQLGHVPG